MTKIPIPIKKLIEKINIFILKESFQTQSKKIKDYYFDLNDRTIFKKEKKIKLTEKELQLILYLDLKKILKILLNCKMKFGVTIKI